MKIKVAGNKAAEAQVPDGQISLIPVDLIADHPNLPNRELDSDWVKELKNSIETNGLDVPILVWNGGNPNATMKIGGEVHPSRFLIAGLHRREAITSLRKSNPARFKELFNEGVPSIVRGGSLEEAICAQLRENVQRLDMPAEQVIPVLDRLRDEFKMKNKDIAKHLGKSEAWVSQMFSIGEELGEEGKQEIKKGGLTIKDAGKARDQIKADKKAGKPVDVKKTLAAAKEKTAARKAAGRDRDERKLSLKTAWKRYNSLPTLTIGQRIGILEGVIAYIVGDSNKCPAELSDEVAEKAAEEAKAQKEKEKAKAKKITVAAKK